MARQFRDEYTPWSLVFPVALAVMLGVLAADAVRLIVAGVAAHAALQELNESLKKQTTPGDLPARPGLVEPDSAEAPVQYAPGASSPQLPGLLQANRERANRACIGGTVSVRESNGWSQDNTTGSPKGCTATGE